MHRRQSNNSRSHPPAEHRLTESPHTSRSPSCIELDRGVRPVRQLHRRRTRSNAPRPKARSCCSGPSLFQGSIAQRIVPAGDPNTHVLSKWADRRGDWTEDQPGPDLGDVGDSGALLRRWRQCSLRERVICGTRTRRVELRSGPRTSRDSTSMPGRRWPLCLLRSRVLCAERLLRYCARPGVALDRLALRPDGRFSYRVKHPYGGKTHRVMTAMELMARLASIVAPPRFPPVRCYGCFAPGSKPTNPSLAKRSRQVVPRILAAAATYHSRAQRASVPAATAGASALTCCVDPVSTLRVS